MSNALALMDGLRSIELFAELTDEELERAAKAVFTKRYATGQTLFFSGMPGELMYIVLSGQLEIYRGTSGQEEILAQVNPGEFSGEGSLILEGKRSTNCRVTRDSELLILTKKSFHDLAKSHPAVTTKLLTAFLKTNIIRLRGGKPKVEIG